MVFLIQNTQNWRHGGHPDQARRADPRVPAHNALMDLEELKKWNSEIPVRSLLPRARRSRRGTSTSTARHRVKAARENSHAFPDYVDREPAPPAFAADELPHSEPAWELRSVDGGDGKPVTLTNQKARTRPRT
jgi:hypothetical protein